MTKELHLKVFQDRSELVRSDGSIELFPEGPSSINARNRYEKITAAFQNGFLENQIKKCIEDPASLRFELLNEDHIELIDNLNGSLTSEVGKALIGLTILQLAIKTIEPSQSIRLHKGGTARHTFSWQEGISMRTIDSTFLTPMLRRFDLLRINKDGIFMTRTLAENYPYSKVYKANMKGGRAEWAEIVENLESGGIDSEIALLYLLSKLLNNAESFKKLSAETLETLETQIKAGKYSSKKSAVNLISSHIDISNYAARIMEIAMHSLFQALAENAVFDTMKLIPLSQMRSANKKHGNVGDVELSENNQITIAWDAKYGKSYLREELEELDEKIAHHPNVQLAGFVTSLTPDLREEIRNRINDLSEKFDVNVQILTFSEWVNFYFGEAEKIGIKESDLASGWIKAYTESIAQRRSDIAPIDEPCHQWLESLKIVLS